jgi:NTP pyrophosphatase (non-canonical NTP hydrolase)
MPSYTFIEYQGDANSTQAPGFTDMERLNNAALGLTEEGGEVAGHIKKVMFHGHLLDPEYVKKELGDILWYIAQACTALGTTMELVAEGNRDKLRARYTKGFTHEQSLHRPEHKSAVGAAPRVSLSESDNR